MSLAGDLLQVVEQRTRKEGGRIVRERISWSGGMNELTVVVADRFIVSVQGQGVGIDQLRSAVGGLDLGKLESLKESGAQK